MSSEIGSAYLSIIPSFQGGARGIANQLDGHMGAAGQSGGAAYAGGMSRGASRTSFLSTGLAMGAAFAGAFAVSGLASIASAVKDYLGSAIDSASNLAESQSKTGQIFGDATGQVIGFARTAATRLGQSEQTVLDGASTFGIFGKAAGLAGSDLAGFSLEMVTLATDLASFNNTSPEQAIEAIGAALRGESEPIRAYGVMLDDATLKARAMSLGIYDGTGTLTQQQKILAAHAEILAQTSTQQGDFARTSEGLANQQRIVNAQLENFKTTVGASLLPVVTDLFATFADWGIPMLEELAKWFGKNGESVKSFILGAVDAGLLFADVVLAMLGWASTWHDGVLTVMLGISRAVWVMADQVLIAATAAFGWMPGMGEKFAGIRAEFDTTRAASETQFRAMRAAADKVTQGIGAARDTVRDLREKVRALDGAEAKVNIKVTQTGAIPSGATFTGGIAKRASGGPVVAGRPYLVGEMGPELIVPQGAGTVLTASTTAGVLGGQSGPVDLTERTIAGIASAVVGGIDRGISASQRAQDSAGW